jgi:hypothetical protein
MYLLRARGVLPRLVLTVLRQNPLVMLHYRAATLDAAAGKRKSPFSSCWTCKFLSFVRAGVIL